jgi:hypothetical protein
VPSYSTVYAIVTAIDPGLRMLGQEGLKRYREVFDLIHCREAELIDLVGACSVFVSRGSDVGTGGGG